VGLRLAVEAMTLHTTLKAAPLGGANYINSLAYGKDVGIQLLADLVAVQLFRLDGDLPQVAQSGDLVAPEMLELSFAEALGLGFAESDLDRRVAVPFWRLLLRDVTGTNLNDRHRHDDAFIEDLRHADFSTQ
jgi:hypothetical protein